MAQVVPPPARCVRCGATSAGSAPYCTWCGNLLLVAQTAAPATAQGAPPSSSWPAPAWQPPGAAAAWPAATPSHAPQAARGWPPPLSGSFPAVAPAGWFADPFGRYAFRYWDGVTWTRHAFSNSPAVDPLPWWLNGSRRFRGGADTALFALLGLVIPYAFAALAEFGYSWLHLPGGPYVLIVVFSTVFWSGLLATCNLVSRRFGTGSLRTDLQIRFRPVDLPIAVLGAFATLWLAGLVALLIEHLPWFHLPEPTEPLVPSTTVPAAAWAVLILCTCVGAPIFEELYFRGLLQTVLVERTGRAVGVLVTALVFACGHIFNAPGLAGVAYAMEIVPAGIVLCCIRQVTGRLGSSMVTHCLYNSSVLVLLAVHLGYFRH